LTGYIIVVSPDPTLGYIARTYPTEDDKILAVVAMLEMPTQPPPTLRRIRVLGAAGSWINIRTGPFITTTNDIGNLYAGEVRDVYQTQMDGAGNEWVKISIEQAWVCRVYGGVVKAEWI
jgi:hypothetical protein